MSRIVIVSAGDLGDEVKNVLNQDDVIIACDAGYRHCERLGIAPAIVLGDFDSAPQPDREDLIVLPRVKDDTDTHYAAKLAVKQGAEKVLMLGALGGRRLEHTLANLATAFWLAKNSVDVSVLGEYSLIRFVLPGQTICLRKGDYRYFSVFPYEGKAEGVCVRGAAYSVEDAELCADFPIGVSNEFNADEVAISTIHGALLVVETKAD